MKNQVVVIGLGRFGSSVARALYNFGHDVLAIDKDDVRVQNMMGQATFAVAGDAANENVLTELGVPQDQVCSLLSARPAPRETLETVPDTNAGRSTRLQKL